MQVAWYLQIQFGILRNLSVSWLAVSRVSHGLLSLLPSLPFINGLENADIAGYPGSHSISLPFFCSGKMAFPTPDSRNPLGPPDLWSKSVLLLHIRLKGYARTS